MSQWWKNPADRAAFKERDYLATLSSFQRAAYYAKKYFKKQENPGWWRKVNWREWLDVAAVVDRPTERQAMVLLMLQSDAARGGLRALMEANHAALFKAAVGVVLREQHKVSLKDVHFKQGVVLTWEEIDLYDGKKPQKVAVMVKIDKAA